MRRVINVTGSSGHTDVFYRTNEDLKKGEKLEKGEVSETDARIIFERLMQGDRESGGRKRVPFAVAADSTITELKKFDPEAQEITFVSQIAGGCV